MQLELIDCYERIRDTLHYEFAVGEYPLLRQGSVYLDEDAFSLIEIGVWKIAPDFAPCGVTKISGRRIERLAAGLREFAKAVAASEGPREFRSLARVPEDAQDQIEDWGTAKPQLCRMLRDLELWLLAVEARKQPVTILGL